VEQVVATGGPWALCAFLIVLIVGALVRGELVTKSQLSTAEKRADRWEAVALEAMRQNGRLIPAAEVAASALDKLPSAVQSASEGGVA
jgi:16S rRNA U1498 N3-methylase RsmE